jgi:hypothetical protein
MVSPAYPDRPYCQQEMARFLASKDSGRVILVALRPFEKGGLPDQIRDNTYISFFEYDRRRDTFKPFIEGYRDNLVVEHQYWARLRDVIAEIRRIVDAEDAKTPARARAYVHMATGPLSGRVARVRQELLNRGFEVAPRGDIPTTAERLREVAEEAAATADFAVHLLDDGEAFIPEGGDESADAIQLATTAARYTDKPSFRRFIWAGERGQVRPELVNNRGEELISRPFEPFFDTMLGAIDEAFSEAGAGPPQPVSLVKLPGCDIDTVRFVASKLGELDVIVEPIQGSPEILGELAARDNPVVLCWGDSPAAEISLLVGTLVANTERRVGLFRLKPDEFEQELFSSPGLIFNTALASADATAAENALRSLVESPE